MVIESQCSSDLAYWGGCGHRVCFLGNGDLDRLLALWPDMAPDTGDAPLSRTGGHVPTKSSSVPRGIPSLIRAPSLQAENPDLGTLAPQNQPQSSDMSRAR